MSFKVIWLKAALGPPARAYTELRESEGEPEVITRAMARIDQLLETDPLNQGESRSPGERIMTEAPLTVRYEIHDEERVVIVFKAAYRPRKT